MLVEGDFSIDILGLNDYAIRCSISPKTEGTEYLYGIIDRATYDRFSSDDYFWDYIIENTPDFADRKVSGDTPEASFERLAPQTQYVVYCAGIDNEGNNVTDVSLLKFTTGAPLTFRLSQEIDGAFANLIVTPSYDDRLYFNYAFTVRECDKPRAEYTLYGLRVRMRSLHTDDKAVQDLLHYAGSLCRRSQLRTHLRQIL